MSASFSTTLKVATAALAITILGATAPGAVSPAEAKRGFYGHGHGHHKFYGNFHRRHFYGSRFIYGSRFAYGPRFAYAGGYGGCYGFKQKAYRTGSRYWWARYRDCRGY